MKSIITILLILIALPACKDTDCPAFPEKLAAYFPYQKGDLLRFTNLNSDTLSLQISENWKTGAYSFAWNCKCACGADAGFITDIDSNFLIKIEANIEVYNEEDLSRIECHISDSQFKIDDFLVKKEGINPFLPENSKLFGDTIKMENETFNRFNHVVIVYDIGLIEFWDNNQNCKWIRIE